MRGCHKNTDSHWESEILALSPSDFEKTEDHGVNSNTEGERELHIQSYYKKVNILSVACDTITRQKPVRSNPNHVGYSGNMITFTKNRHLLKMLGWRQKQYCGKQNDIFKLDAVQQLRVSVPLKTINGRSSVALIFPHRSDSPFTSHPHTHTKHTSSHRWAPVWIHSLMPSSRSHCSLIWGCLWFCSFPSYGVSSRDSNRGDIIHTSPTLRLFHHQPEMIDLRCHSRLVVRWLYMQIKSFTSITNVEKDTVQKPLLPATLL